MALDTGGRVVKGTDDLASAMLQTARESRTYYLLGYVSTNPKRDGKFRSIKVSVARPGPEVRARKGYYASRKDGGEEARPGGRARPAGARRSRLAVRQRPHPLRMASYVLGRGASGKATVVLSADLDLRAVDFDARRASARSASSTPMRWSPRWRRAGSRSWRSGSTSPCPPTVHARVLKSGLPILRDFELASGRTRPGCWSATSAAAPWARCGTPSRSRPPKACASRPPSSATP